MQTLWEAHFLSPIIIPILISVLIIALAIVVFIGIHKEYAGFIRSVCAVVVLITLYFVASTLSSALKDWGYAQNNKTVVEGIIEDYITGENGSDRFSVNGVEFWCTPVDNNLFAYTYTQRDSKCVIIGEGQYVRITYCVQNDLNGIIKIEEPCETGGGLCLEPES